MGPDRRLVRTAFAAFFASRAIVLLLLICGSQMAFLGKVYSDSVWETRITIAGARVIPELSRVSMVGDSWFYRSIAERGYDVQRTGGQAPNWAFFPLFPLTVRVLGPTGDFAMDGLLLSHVAFAIALLLLGPLLTRMNFAVEDAERAIWYVAFFPTSYFFSLPMTESLFLALSVGSMLAGVTRRWWLAGILGGFAALTRSPGVLLVIPLTILFFEQRERPRWKILWLLAVPAGTGVFMWHLSRVTGDALAFIHAQESWGRGASFFWSPIVKFLAHPASIGEPWNLTAMNFATAVLLVAAAVFLMARRQWAFGAYVLASVLLPLATGSLQSLARYALVAFPLYAALAMAGRRPNIDRLITAVMITLFGCLIALLVLRVDFALA